MATSPLFPGALLLDANTDLGAAAALARSLESCRSCGYTPSEDEDGGEPLIDDDQCVECHFAELQACERGEIDDGS